MLQILMSVNGIVSADAIQAAIVSSCSLSDGALVEGEPPLLLSHHVNQGPEQDLLSQTR